jgi:kumamolisin
VAIAKPARFVRLPIALDFEPLAAEAAAADLGWMPSQWKWHLGTQFCVLRAGPPGATPGSQLTSGADVDQPVLARLPRLRAALDGLFPERARLAWLGRLPSRTWIHLHTDNTPHWDHHHRVHIPLITNPRARLCLGGRFAHLPAGSAWILNNSKPHGAINDGPARIHLMVDLPPTRKIERMIAGGQPVAGRPDPEALAKLRRDPLRAAGRRERSDPDLMRRLLSQ